MASVRRYLTASLAYDRAVIMRAAWRRARMLAETAGQGPAAFRRVTTAKAELSWSLKRVWAEARAERELAVWAAGAEAREAADKVRLATLTPHQRKIETAETTLMFAEHTDAFTAANNAAVAAARAQLAAFHSHA